MIKQNKKDMILEEVDLYTYLPRTFKVVDLDFGDGQGIYDLAERIVQGAVQLASSVNGVDADDYDVDISDVIQSVISYIEAESK